MAGSRSTLIQVAHTHPAGIVITVLAVAACLALPPAQARAAPGQSPGTQPSRPVLFVSGDHEYPPFEFVEHGRPTGFNIELMQAVGEAMGYTVHVRLGPWNQVRQDLESGRVDVLAGMYYSKERDASVDFSIPHTLVTSGLFVRKGSPISSLEDIRGREIIVQKGDLMNDYLRSTGLASSIIPVTDPAEALRLLSSGRHDGALLSSKMQGLYYAKVFKLTNLVAIETGLPAGHYCFAVAQGNHQLVQKLNEGLNILKSTGRYKEIQDRWFGVYEEQRWREAMLRYLVFPLAAILVLLAGILAWSWSLRRQVSIRTRDYQESEQRLATIFRESPAIITIFTADEGRILDINDAFTHILGYSRQEAVGRTALELGILVENPDDKDLVLQKIREAGQIGSLEILLRTKSGQIVTCLLSAAPSMVRGQQCILSVITDITGRKKAEEEKARLEAQLLQAQKMEAVGSLAGGVAHDFNNLMTAILGNAELALDSLEKKHVSQQSIVHEVTEIKLAAQRAASLTRQLLMFSRKEVAKPEVFDLNATLDGMTKMLRRLIPENIELKYSLTPDAYPVYADARQMEQVIVNLAVNARDAMPDGGVLEIGTIGTTLDDSHTADHADARTGPHTVLSVSDTGQGMDETTMARIFEPFFTTKERGRGTGLGLSSVFGIVKQAGGHITVKSRPGMGSSFCIYLPAAEGPARHDTPPAKDAGVKGGTETILLCEDDDIVRGLGMKILASAGYRVIDAANAQDAIGRMREHDGPVHLLLTDVIMPGMNGSMLAEQLKKEFPAMKILFMSGYTEDHILNRGIMEPGVNLIMKPFTRTELLKGVRRTIDSGT